LEGAKDRAVRAAKQRKTAGEGPVDVMRAQNKGGAPKKKFNVLHNAA